MLSVIMATRKELLNIKGNLNSNYLQGISEIKLDKIQEAAMKIEKACFITGKDILSRR